MRKALLGSFAALVCLLALPAQADITLNLKDAEISTLIATVSDVTGKNFIVDNRVKGKVTVISASPMSANSLYETFLAVLQVNGFAAVPSGGTIKIIPEANVRQEGGSYSGDGTRLPRDDIVTHVYQLQNVSATQLVPILRPLIPQWGHLAAYQPNNTLIIADRAANVARLGALIREMDQAGDRDIEKVQLKFASAAEVVRVLTSMLQQDAKQGDAAASKPVVIADERSNSILIGGDKSDRARLLSIVHQLDVELPDGGATQVVYLRYASAENLAPILEGYAQQVKQSEQRSSASAAGGSAPTTSASSSSGGGGAAGGGNGDTRVLSDKDTNSLIITASPKVMRQIRDVIAQLDIQRAQVLVEGIIAEVSAAKQRDVGVNWAVYNPNRIAAAGILSSSVSSALTTFASTGTAATAAATALTPGINIAAGSTTGNTMFGVLLQALRNDGDTNVLSTPSLVTLDNEEAKFSVGQEVPFLSGSYANTGSSSTSGAVNPFQTIERKDVGLTLSVTPQISGVGDTIKLKLSLETSGIASGTAGTANLITNKRTLNNVVGIENGQILVIGGLIDDQIQNSQSSIPLLGDIPLIGGLFRNSSVKKTKQNLMLFIRPTILRKADDIDYYTRVKYDNVRQSLIEAANRTGGKDNPLLKSYDDYRSNDRAPTSVPGPIVLPGTAPTPIAAPSAGAMPGEVTTAPPADAPSEAPGAITPPSTTLPATAPAKSE